MSYEGECERKVRYAPKAVAKERGRELGMRAYRCRWCNGYHLTSDLDGATSPKARAPRRLIAKKGGSDAR